MARPLDGIRVLDLTQLLPGPYCTGILADLGAEVIKIEPRGGDFGRLLGGMFSQVNRGKKSITLNLKDQRAQRVFHRLASEADVVVEGFRPGTTGRLGVGYEACRETNPRLIYCSISGFGQDGPYRDRPGHDINYMSLGGALSLLKGRDGHPVNPGLEMADVTAGLEAAVAILAALLARGNTGRGQFVDISMLDCVVSTLPMHANTYLSLGVVPPTNLTDMCSHYRVFDTADGDYLVMGIVHEDWFWTELADALDGFEDVRDLKHAQRMERRDELIRRMSDAFRTRTLAGWLEHLEGRDIPYSTINDVAQALEDPQVLHRGMKVTIPGPGGDVTCVGTPYKLSDTPVTFDAPAPGLGEQTDSILAESGFSTAEIADMRESGVI